MASDNWSDYEPIWTNGTPGTVVVTDPKYGAYGDGVHDDTAAIQAAIDTAQTAGGGTVYLPPGTYSLSKSLSITTGNVQLLLKGAGIGVTTLTQTEATVDGISATGYLLRLEDFTLNGAGTAATGTGISITTTSIIGRIWLTRIQATGFNIGFGFTGHSFDQMTLDRVNFGGNNNHGLYITDSASSALLAIRDSIFDDNGGQGFHITPSGLSLLTMENVESVNNAQGNTLQTVVQATISVLDIEDIPSAQWGLNLSNVQSFVIQSSEFMAKSGETPHGGLYFNSPGGIFGFVHGNNFSPDASYGYGAFFIEDATNVVWQGNKDKNQKLISPILYGTGTQTGLVSLDTLTNFSPQGLLTAPTMPTSGTAYTNNFGVTARVFVSGGTVTAIALNGTDTGITSGQIILGPGETIALTYSATPTWTWFGL